MRIIITGNMGYVGPGVVRHLRSALPGAHLTGVDLGYFGHCLTGVDVFPEHMVDVQIFADVRDIDESVLEGADGLVQLAAISNDPMGKAYEQVTHDVNCAAAVRLTKLARDVGLSRMVFASSCSVYGYAEGDARDEDSELNPLTAYAKSKINTELAVEDLATDDLTITCLRFPTACGMSNRVRLDLVLNDFVASALAHGRIDILSDGTPWRPLIDTQDMARGIEWALTRPPAEGGNFLSINVGRNDANFQVKQLAESVQSIIPGVDVSVNPDAQPDKRSYRVDFSRYAALAPDHLPQVSLEQSITELRDGLTKAGFRNQDFRESEQIRLKVLASHRAAERLDENLRWTGR